MKKRILSILLTLCMVLCLVPITASAMEIYIDLTITGQAHLTLEVVSGDSIDNIKEKIRDKTGFSPDAQRLFLGEKELENGRTLADYNIPKESTLRLRLQRTVQLGTDALNKTVNTANAPTVYFGQNHENKPAAWRVIGYDGNGVAGTAGNMTLLAAGNMGVVRFDDDGVNNEYAPSDLKTAIDALAEKLTTEENAAVKKRTLTSGSYNGENTDCVAGAQVDNAVFWPLSTAEAFAVNQDLRIADPEHPSWASSYWWLRSPGDVDYAAAAVRGNGDVSYDGEDVIIMLSGVRPAFSLKSSSVLFTSAAVGGKPVGGLTPISEYTGNEWKLTLNDSDRNGFLVTLRFYSENTVRFDYKGAKTGASEYISAMVINGETIKYYGRLKNVSETGMESGNLTLTLPVAVDVEKGDRLFVFNEQCNGDCKTDYASDLLELPLKSIGSNTPRLRINAESNEWEVSYDEGQTWTSLGVKATGADGQAGKDGKDGLVPYIGANGNWWLGDTDTGVKASVKGDKGDSGQDGKDGITPQLKIGDDNIWYVSYDGGQTWVSLGVKATGADGKDGVNGKDGTNGASGSDGKDGKDGVDGKDGKDGKDGVDGKDGKDGADGKDGVGIAKAEINADGELVLTYTDGRTVNLGKVVGADGKDGLTPFIGENGNWWIGTTDTGMKAATDAVVHAGSENISAASSALIVIGSVAGLALLGNLGLILYIVLKKKKGLV